MRKPLGPSIGLLVVMVLVLAACAPVATPTPTQAPTTMPTPTPSPWALPPGFPTPTPRDNSTAQPPSGAQVVTVNREIEHDGITVGLKEVWLTDRETVLRFWHNCTPFRNLETMGTADLWVDGANVHGSGGGGPGCDASYLREFRFPALPRGAREIAFRYGPFLGPDTRDLTLEIPIGRYLSKLDPKFGGEVEMDLVAESEGLAYRFTKVSAGAANFSLRYEPANDPARAQPFSGPPGVSVTIEDDRGNVFTPGSYGTSGWDSNNDFALKDGTLSFKGGIDTSASVWKLTASKLGRVYRGPWEFRVDVSSYTGGLPLVTPPPTAISTTEPTPTPIPRLTSFDWPSRLKQALDMVPQEFADKPLKYADYLGARVASGRKEVRGIEAVRKIDAAAFFAGPYGALPQHDQFGSYAATLYELTGVDLLLGFDLGIWLDDIPEGFRSSTFMAMQGPLDREGIAGKLKAMEYKEAQHEGIPYYWLYEEPVPKLTHPLRQLAPYLNRIAFADDELLVGPTTGIIEDLIDVERGKAPSLAQSRPHTALVDAVGEGLLGAAFVTPRWILENWNRVNAASGTRLDRYLEGPDRWGTLSPYTLGLLGYRYRGWAEEMVVALYYPDPGAAGRDGQEFLRRWGRFYYDAVGGREVEVPVTRSCSPFSARMIVEADFSVLVGSCPLRTSGERDVAVKGPDLWLWLFDTRELQFMAPDIEALKQTAEAR